MLRVLGINRGGEGTAEKVTQARTGPGVSTSSSATSWDKEADPRTRFLLYKMMILK